MSEDLSLADNVTPNIYIRVLWIFDYVIDDLKQQLLEYLRVYCPIVLYQIVSDDKKVNYGQLIESTTDKSNVFSREKKLDMSIAHYINCSFQELDVCPYPDAPTDTSPLFFLHQITVQDGTLLAIGVHHKLTDGHGFFQLIDRFSSWIRQKNHPKVKYFIHDRSLLKPAAGVHYDHPEYITLPPQLSSSQTFETSPIEVLVKKYSKRQLFEKLKITASNVTFNDVLVAWLTQVISQIRRISSDETVNVFMAYNARNEWGVGRDYFGNCFFVIKMQFSMIDLNNCSVDDLAQKVNTDKKKSMSRDYLASGLAYIKTASERVAIAYNPWNGRDLFFSNWCHFPLYEVDFGQGPPKRVAFAGISWDGFTVIIPTQTDEVELCTTLGQNCVNELLTRLE